MFRFTSPRDHKTRNSRRWQKTSIKLILCCSRRWKSLLMRVWSARWKRQSALQPLSSSSSPLPVWFYAFDPRRTLRFAFLAFRPQSLLGYLLSPPAPSTTISQQERTAAAPVRRGGRTWDTFDSKSNSWNSWKYPNFCFFYRRAREQGVFVLFLKDERVNR